MAWLHPEYLWLFWCVPAVIGLYMLAAWRRRALQARFGDVPLVRRLAAQLSGRRRRYKSAIIVACVALFSLALAGPQIGTRLREVKREGIDLVIALDVSLSMMAEDVAPNRLGRARNEVKKLLSELRGDRVGLVIFAGDAFVQCPLTTDYSALRMFLDVTTPDLIGTPGTDFGTAFDVAIQAFDAPFEGADPNDTRSKAILFVSDGENHFADLDDLLADARAEEITLFAAGVGDTQGVPIPEYVNGQKTGRLKRDLQGTFVQTRLEEEGLKAISADGAYFQIGRTSSSLPKIIAAFERLDSGVFGAEEFEEYELKYQWPLALALMLLLMEGLLSERKKQNQKA